MPVLRLGRQLSYGEAGFGEDAILVHGSPGDGRSWARVVRELPPGIRALTPDLPGYGGSEPLSCDPADRTKAMAASVGALIEGRATPVWLCGHSYGGNVALHAAIAHRERIKGLLLIEPVFIRALELAHELDLLVQIRAYFANYMVRVAFAEPDIVGLMIAFWFGKGAFEAMPQPIKRFLNDAAAKNAEDVQAALSEGISQAQLAAFDRPVHIVIGGASPAVTRSIGTALEKLLPHARLLDMPAAGHGMLDSHPREVAGLIDGLRRASDVPAT
jgi:pimeloyl-ACP methyl ester carboxylesterase